MLPVFEEDIFEHTSSEIVSKSSGKLSEKYKVQAHPREINLFYLNDGIRNRIVQFKDQFVVHDTNIIFSKDELKNELKNHPERFSPQRNFERALPGNDITQHCFGGGGEIAYWLELNDLFDYYKVPFPVLFVRNSFMIIEKRYHILLEKLNLMSPGLFKGEQALLHEIVARQSSHRLILDGEKLQLEKVYSSLKKSAKEIDITLVQHVESLEIKTLKKLSELEKKMFRAEKRKFKDHQNQLGKIFSILFPQGNLQERTENFMLYYAKWGSSFFEMLYDNSLTLEQKFCILEEM